VYFFNIVRAILFFFCIFATVVTIKLIFVSFSTLFIKFCIFIIFRIQFSFLKVIISLLLQYDISLDFDEIFLIIRFHLPAFAFAFAN